jgi:ATP adenylyltransferase
MKALWAPWRMDYILGPKEKGCLFCRIRREGRKKAKSNLVLAFRPKAFIMMNKYPYNNGHVMVVPDTHARRLTELDGREIDALFRSVREAENMLFSCFGSDGLNVGVNIGTAAGAGIDEHLHVHLVPRWVGDTSFMTALGEVRTVPQHIDETYGMLRRFLESGRRGKASSRRR